MGRELSTYVLANACCDVFCVLAVMYWIGTTYMHFVAALSRDGFSQRMLRYSSSYRCKGRVWTTQFETHFVFSLILWGIDQHMLMYIFSHRWHDRFWSRHVIHFVYLLAWQGIDQQKMKSLCVFAALGGTLSTYVAIQFLSSLAWDSYDVFCVLAVMGWIYTT